MTAPLSPTAAAVLDACNDAVERLPLSSTPEQFSIALIAAALEAAADQVVPVPKLPYDSCCDISASAIRADFLAIAAELRAQ